MTDLCGTILDGKYELSRLLGEGGMGSVYEATHRLIGRKLAVKFLHNQYVASKEVVIRFQREAQAAAAIGHENIIEVTDMGQMPDGTPYIVMEFLDGSDVKAILSEYDSIPPVRAAHIMVQALSGLQAAHKAGIIHRDLKPENIYLVNKPDRPDYVKLLDFGISKFKSLDTPESKGLTQTGTVLGTPYYMSPEQARGDQNISAKSDIYAMGVILYQMLTGRLPFDAPNYNALLIKIITEDPTPPEVINPRIPPELADTIKIAMARNPIDRFESCIEFRQRLLPFLPGSSSRIDTALSPVSKTAVMAALSSKTQTPLETSTELIAKPSKRLPAIIGIAAVVAAVVAGSIYFGIRSPDTSTTEPPIAPAVTVPVASPQPEGKTQSQSTDSVSFKIKAEPAQAKIQLDGDDLEGNPFAGTFPKSEIVHQLLITADGYKDLMVEAKFDKDRELSYALDKLSQVETKSGPDSSSQSKDSSSSRRKKTKSTEVQITDTTTGDKVEAEDKAQKKQKRKIDVSDPW